MHKAILGITLAAHKLWLAGDSRGVRANLHGADLQGANLRWANLRWANLQEADLQGANLQEANLQGANLQEANLQGANLRWANLQGADLQEANLRWANLQEADRVIGPQRSDGYLFTYCLSDKVVLAGCRRLTLEQYRQHVGSYHAAAKKRETLAILNCLELLIAARESV